ADWCPAALFRMNALNTAGFITKMDRLDSKLQNPSDKLYHHVFIDVLLADFHGTDFCSVFFKAKLLVQFDRLQIFTSNHQVQPLQPLPTSRIIKELLHQSPRYAFASC